MVKLICTRTLCRYLKLRIDAMSMIPTAGNLLVIPGKEKKLNIFCSLGAAMTCFVLLLHSFLCASENRLRIVKLSPIHNLYCFRIIIPAIRAFAAVHVHRNLCCVKGLHSTGIIIIRQ